MKLVKKYQYKLWKHLTKKLFKESAYNMFCLFPLKKCAVDDKAVIKSWRNTTSYPTSVIVSQGYFGSGASALTGCLSEFEGTAGIGATQAVTFGEKGAQENMGDRESDFFWRSGLFSMIDSFYDGSQPEIIDVNIRRFLAHFNTVINEGIVAGGRHGRIINQRFIFSCFDFICSMFEIKEIDRKKLQRGFPVILTDAGGGGRNGRGFLFSTEKGNENICSMIHL